MSGPLQKGTRAALSYVQAVFALLGFVSLVVWLINVVASKHHHPLTYWLVVSLGLLLVASLIWGARRGSPGGDGIHIHMEGGDIINQVAPGQIPFGAPAGPGSGSTGVDAENEKPENSRNR
jgi:hypothetical protein